MLVDENQTGRDGKETRVDCYSDENHSETSKNYQPLGKYRESVFAHRSGTVYIEYGDDLFAGVSNRNSEFKKQLYTREKNSKDCSHYTLFRVFV